MDRPTEQSVFLSKDLINEKDNKSIIRSIFIMYKEKAKMNFIDTIHLQLQNFRLHIFRSSEYKPN